MIIGGIDESARGSLIGPLVICGVSIDEKDVEKLKKLGVNDSKLLTKERREELEPEIKKLVDFHIVRMSAEEIDSKSNIGVNLNKQEAIKMAECIDALKPNKVIIDAPSGIEKFVNHLKQFSSHECEIVAEHKADLKYAVVSAASILAKVDRDRYLRELEKEIGFPLGVGYPHDETTINAVKNNLENKKLMKYVRKSWVTYSNILQKREQSGLDDF